MEEETPPCKIPTVERNPVLDTHTCGTSQSLDNVHRVAPQERNALEIHDEGPRGELVRSGKRTLATRC